MNKKLVYCAEVGIILNKDNNEFDCYLVKDFYDKEYAFFDENRCLFFDYEKAKEYSDSYVKQGVENTYAIIHTDILNLDEEEEQSIKDFCYCESIAGNPTNESLLYFIKKQDKDIIKIYDKGGNK